MANTINISDVFKFVALRPPVSIENKNKETNFIIDRRQPEQTPVGILTKTFDTKDGTKIPEQVKTFIENQRYDIIYPENTRDFLLSKIYDFILTITRNEFANDILSNGIKNILDTEISDYLNSPDTKIILDNLWDRYFAFYILSKTENQNLDILTKNLRVFHLLDYSVKSKINDYETLQKLISAVPVVSKLFTDLPKPLIKAEQPKEEKTSPETIKKYQELWSEIVDTHRALDEIKSLKLETKLISETKDNTPVQTEPVCESTSKLTLVKNRIGINKESIEGLHANTKKILNAFTQNDNFQITEPVMQIKSKLENLYTSAINSDSVEFLKHMPIEAKSIQGIFSLIKSGVFDPLPFKPPTNIRASIKPLGVGDLKVVKQTLKKYVAGEVAHIENVLRGEFKERKHRVLDRTEEIYTVTNETEEETTKDTQTTERFELKKESEKTISEQMSVQAGVTVSGSYGMVTFGAHGDFAYSTASQESNKSSSNFAREVIDKSVSKIQKKTKEERSTKKLHEVEEINTHGIDNRGQPDHAVGIYRWVDKYYDAQIYNYGKRMMFEFIVPEPAAFFEYAQNRKDKKNIDAPPVPYRWIQDPNTKEWKTDGLITHKDITEQWYQGYIRDYNVQGVTPPPPLYKTITVSCIKDSMPLDGNPHTENKQLVIPAGYFSKWEPWWDLSAYWSHYPIIEVIIGNKIFRPLEYPDRSTWTGGGFDRRLPIGNHHDDTNITYGWFWPETPIQVSVNSYDTVSYALNVSALVERTSENYEQWQIQTYEKIMSAYKAMQIEYEQKVAAQGVQQGIVITGQNPKINREIEKTELKKQCVKMLMDTYLFGSFDAMKDDGKNSPDFDIFDALEEGKTIQFFEQAFEWENITYLFYPYFWARKDQWAHKSTLYDNDPLFTKFLQAGSCRVVLPVHPGYNDAIMYFLENNGAIWKGGEPPRLNDPLFISLADELRDQTDDLENATPEGKPWEVVLPTTLVYLQKNSDLPTF